jgi:hypothetical protein
MAANATRRTVAYWIVSVCLAGLFLVELYFFRYSTPPVTWATPVIVIELGLLILLWFRYPSIRKLIGAEKTTWSPNIGSIIQYILFLLVFTSFVIYSLVGQLNKSVPEVAQFSILTISPVLGGLVLAAASNYVKNPQKYSELIHVSQKFIMSTVLFIIFVPFSLMVELFGGINPDSLAANLSDPAAWGRSIYFWLGAPCFYAGILLFLWGLKDLVLALVDIDISDDQKQNAEQSNSDKLKLIQHKECPLKAGKTNKYDVFSRNSE